LRRLPSQRKKNTSPPSGSGSGKRKTRAAKYQNVPRKRAEKKEEKKRMNRARWLTECHNRKNEHSERGGLLVQEKKKHFLVFQDWGGFERERGIGGGPQLNGKNGWKHPQKKKRERKVSRGVLGGWGRHTLDQRRWSASGGRIAGGGDHRRHFHVRQGDRICEGWMEQ